jgi:hypothetical protein
MRHVAGFCYPSQTKQNKKMKKHLCKNSVCSHCGVWCNRLSKCDLGLPSHLPSPRQWQWSQSRNFPIPPHRYWISPPPLSRHPYFGSWKWSWTEFICKIFFLLVLGSLLTRNIEYFC